MSDKTLPSDWKGPGLFVGWNYGAPVSNYIWKKGELDKINPKTNTFEHKIRENITKESDKKFIASLKKKF